MKTVEIAEAASVVCQPGSVVIVTDEQAAVLIDAGLAAEKTDKKTIPRKKQTRSA